MKRKAATASDNGVHPLLRGPAEAVHQLSDEGEARVEDDPELAPGHDACAVCAGPLDCPAACALCDSVRYCSPQHLTDDAPCHATVCSALRFMRQVDRLPEDAQKAPALQPRAAAASSREAQVTPQTQPDSKEEFRAPPRSKHGWQHVAPHRFLRVYPLLGAQGEEGEAQPARKRARQLSSGGEASNSQGGTGGGAHQEGAAALGAAAPSDEADEEADGGLDADDQLRLAAELAECSAVFSYAYTAAYALQSLPAARSAVRKAESEQRPLEMVVLGAAADAELGDLDSWQVIAASLDRDVRIKFVGPEVPEDMAGTEAQRGRVTLRFLQGTYDQAAAGTSGPLRERAPDIYFAFNPGFTVPDYEWAETVKGLARAARSSSGCGRGPGTSARPCLVVATNTAAEAHMEAEWLEEHGWRAEARVEPNPYTSLKLLQSGTLANDLYRKNAWLVTYEHREAHLRKAAAGGRGRRGAKAVAKRAAKALYNAMVEPVARLLRKR